MCACVSLVLLPAVHLAVFVLGKQRNSLVIHTFDHRMRVNE